MIEVEKLEKSFRVARHHRGFLGSFRNLVELEREVVRAVDGVSFSIESGEFVGFIGPNGAGKSTTIKMLTGVLEPSGGQARVGGLDPRRDRLAHTARIGVVFGQRTQLWWDLPVIESYTLLRTYRTPEPRSASRAPAIEFVAAARRRCASLLGQRMRCELAAALLHAPALLFLDEPTIGLDVVAKEAIREFLARENRERGTTILLTTHDLSDIERLCPRMILIDHGKVVYDGAVEAIRRSFGSERRLCVDFDGAAPAELPEGVELEERRAERLVLRFRRDRVPAAKLIAFLSERAPIADLVLEEAPIERIVAELYKRGRP
jgi:ABC-2 type transport system ATP-binding protein